MARRVRTGSADLVAQAPRLRNVTHAVYAEPSRPPDPLHPRRRAMHDEVDLRRSVRTISQTEDRFGRERCRLDAELDQSPRPRLLQNGSTKAGAQTERICEAQYLGNVSGRSAGPGDLEVL